MKGIATRKSRRKKIRISLDRMTKEVVSLIFNSNSQIASVGLRDLAGDMRRYNKPGYKNRNNWRIRSPLPISQIDFSFISSVIKSSARD
jgi:4-alpha-glucanotransferase